MSKVEETILEINLANLTHNYTYLRSKLSPEVKFMAVVKASGYGSDAVVIAKHLEKLGVEYLAVVYASEGVTLRQAGVQTPILVLHPQPVNFSLLIEYRLEPSIYSFRILSEFVAIAERKQQKEYPVHIKFNTGLNRLGFLKNDVDHILEKIKKTNSLRIVSLFSHLAASEDHQEKEFTLGQIRLFKKIGEEMIGILGYRPIMHQSNTSGILNYPEAHFDMVRAGIGLYGYGNEAKYDNELKPVASLKSIISQIHRLEPGETLGYNRAFTASGCIKTATIPVGHADGIGRLYGNKKGFVVIQGKKAFIIGNVCMDMLMVDITDIACNEGDEVVVFDENISATDVAESAGTISYELLTAISPRVKRIVVDKN